MLTRLMQSGPIDNGHEHVAWLVNREGHWRDVMNRSHEKACAHGLLHSSSTVVVPNREKTSRGRQAKKKERASDRLDRVARRE